MIIMNINSSHGSEILVKMSQQHKAPVNDHQGQRRKKATTGKWQVT
jgi:hypothetical protein